MEPGICNCECHRNEPKVPNHVQALGCGFCCAATARKERDQALEEVKRLTEMLEDIGYDPNVD